MWNRYFITFFSVQLLMKLSLLHVLLLTLCLVGFRWSESSACSLGGRITADRTVNDTVCVGQSLTLFLQSYDGTILRWEKSENNGSWNTLNVTTAFLTTDPLVRETRFRAVVRKNNCPETYSEVRRFVPAVPNLRVHLQEVNRGYEYWVRLSGFFRRDSLPCRIYLSQKSEFDSRWSPAQSVFIAPVEPNQIRSLTTLSFPLLRTLNRPINKNSYDVWYRYSAQSLCGVAYSDSFKVTYRHETVEVETSRDTICLDEPFKVWVKNHAHFRDSLQLTWYGINLANQGLGNRLRYFFRHDPNREDCYNQASDNNTCSRHVLNRNYNIPDTLILGQIPQDENDGGYDKTIWDEQMSDQTFLNSYQQESGVPLKVSLYAAYRYPQSNMNQIMFPPSAPNLRLSRNGNELKLEWEAVANTYGYSINYRLPGNSNFTTLGYTTNTEYFVRNLDPEQAYEFQVRTQGQQGGGEVSYLYDPHNTVACSLPNSIRYVSLSQTSAIFEWDAVPGATEYRVECSDNNFVTAYGGTTTQTQYQFTGLRSGGMYHLRIAAVCDRNLPPNFNWFMFYTRQSDQIYASKRIDIPVAMPTNGGRVKANAYICQGDAPPALKLMDHRGRVLFWESSTDGERWSSINHTATTYTPRNLTETTYFRVQVQNGNCAVRPSKFARVAVSPRTQAGTLVGKNSRCPLDETPTITLRGQVGQVDHWQISYDGSTWQRVANIATNYKPDTVLRDTWVRAVVISPGCNPETTAVHKITYLSALQFNIPRILAPEWVCNVDTHINLELAIDPALVVDWEVNDCCARPALWEKTYQGGKNKIKYPFIKNCIPGCCYGKTTYWFRVRLRYSMLCNDVYTIEVPVHVYCCPVEIECKGGKLCRDGICMDITNPRLCPNPWVCEGEKVSLFPSPEGLPYFDRWEYAELDQNNQWVWVRVPNSEPEYLSHPLYRNTCFRSVSVINGREFFGKTFCVRVLPNTRPGYVSRNRSICKGENSDTLRAYDWLGEIKIWQSSTDSVNWTDIIHSDSVYQSQALQQTTWFRSVVRLCNAKCALGYSKPVKITVKPFDKTIGGIVTALYDTVCAGGRPQLKLQNHVGAVVYWQETAPNDPLFANARRYNVFDDVLTGDAITGNRLYRACVKNSDCETKFSAPFLVKVGQPRMFANITNDIKTCPGQKATLRILQRKGDIVRWEMESGNNWLPLPENGEQLLTPALSQDTRFRVVLKISGCNETASVPVTVKTDGQVRAGTIQGDTTRCIINISQNQTIYPSATFELKNYQGVIQYWETSTNNGGTWTRINHTSPLFTVQEARLTTKIRAMVGMNGCGTALSTNVGTLTVNPHIDGGKTRAEANNVCPNGRTRITLQNYSGPILYWEYSTNSYFSGATRINETTTQIETPALSLQWYPYQYFFRAVGAGGCGGVPSASVMVQVNSNMGFGYVGGMNVVCSGKTTRLTYQRNSPGQILHWEYSTDNGQNWQTVSHTFDTLTTIPVTGTLIYKVYLEVNGCGRGYSQPMTINPSAQAQGGTAYPEVTNRCLSRIGEVVSPCLHVTNTVGRIKYWQASTNNGTSWKLVDYSNSSNICVNIYQTTWYRAVIVIDGCDSAYSAIAKVNITPFMNAGKVVASDLVVCKSSPFPVGLELVKHTATVTRWEQTTDANCLNNWTPINNTDAFYFAENLTQTTCYRAVVANACTTKVSIPVKINVIDQPSVGSISVSEDLVCIGTSVRFQAQDVQGNILGWQQSLDGRTWQDINGAVGSRLIHAIMQNTRIRVVVGMDGCGEVFSQAVFVETRPRPQAGIIQAPATLCQTERAEIKLSGNNRRIIRWEATNGNWEDANRIYSGQSTIKSERLYLSTYFRAVLEGCQPTDTLYSPTVLIRVNNCRSCGIPVGKPYQVNNNHILLNWTAVSGQAQYEVSYRIANAPTWSVFPLTTYTTTVLSNFERCVNYEVRYRAVCNGVYSDYSPVQIVNYLGTPVITSTNYVSESSCMVAWTPLANAYYRVQYRERGAVNWIISPFNLTQNSRLLIGLKRGATYEIRVIARCRQETQSNPPTNESETKEYTNTGPVYDCSYNVPSAPAYIKVSDVQGRSAKIKWQNIPQAVGMLVVYGQLSNNKNSWTQATVCSPTDSLELKSLAPNTRYGFYLQALCASCSDLNARLKRSTSSKVVEFQTIRTREDEEIVAEAINMDERLTVYPNPGKDFFNITATDAYKGKNIYLYDNLGRQVWEGILSDEPINLSGISAGLYTLRISDRYIKLWIEE